MLGRACYLMLASKYLYRTEYSFKSSCFHYVTNIESLDSDLEPNLGQTNLEPSPETEFWSLLLPHCYIPVGSSFCHCVMPDGAKSGPKMSDGWVTMTKPDTLTHSDLVDGDRHLKVHNTEACSSKRGRFSAGVTNFSWLSKDADSSKIVRSISLFWFGCFPSIKTSRR